MTSYLLCLHGALLGDIYFNFTRPRIFMQAVKAEWLLRVTHPWLVSFATEIIYVCLMINYLGINFLESINRIVFFKYARCVFCEVGTKIL